jgi:hypothetical protein
MKLFTRLSLWVLLLLPALVAEVWAADDSLAARLLGSPLLILGILVIVDVVAFAYHRIRK